MPYGMDAFMLGIGMLGEPRTNLIPVVPGSSSEVFLPAADRAAKGSSPWCRAGDTRGVPGPVCDHNLPSGGTWKNCKLVAAVL